MRILYCTLVLTLFCTACKKKETDWRKFYGLKGNVESVQSKTYEPVVTGDSITAGEPIAGDNSVIRFNKNGEPTEQIIYQANGDVMAQLRFSWENGRISHMKQFNGNGKLNNTDVYEYEGGTLKKIIVRNADGEKEDYSLLKENSDHQLKESTRFNSEGKKMYTWKNTFDGNNHVIENVFTNEDLRRTTRKRFTWNTARDEVVEIREKTNDEPETLTKYKYQYDSQGNWTRRTDYNQNDKPVGLVLRNIRYY